METQQLKPDTSAPAQKPENVTTQKNAVTGSAAAQGTQSVQLRLINQSNDQGRGQIVIFQKGVATSLDELAVAWRVIRNLPPGWSHAFTYSYQVQATVKDAYGNESPALDIQPGQRGQVIEGPSGTEFQIASQPASASNEIQILNGLTQGAITANILRDGLPAAVKSGIAPGQLAAFTFKPSIYIGVVSQVEPGEILDSAIISSVNTQLSLLGIASAEIIMSGGGAGSSATPFRFTLENVRFA